MIYVLYNCVYCMFYLMYFYICLHKSLHVMLMFICVAPFVPCPVFQVVSAVRMEGTDNPLEIVYFVEGKSGERMTAVQTANLLNSLDVQRAAIILGYPVQGVLAQREYLFFKY